MPTRTKLGILALLLLIASGILKLFESSSPLATEGWAACLRIGLILGGCWLAYPDLSRLPLWTFPAIAVLGLAAFRWRFFLYAVPPVLFLGWLLIPRRR